MLKFMDYVVQAFGRSSSWNPDNSYSSLTATSDALLSFTTPSTLSLSVSSLSTPHFATSYTLSTIGIIDGSVSYLYSTIPLQGVAASTSALSLRHLVRGYRDIYLPYVPPKSFALQDGERKPTLLHATLLLPPPSTLTAIYVRRINPRTLCSISLNSKSIRAPVHGSLAPPASLLATVQHDSGRYSVEALGSTDSALLGLRGLWNFGFPASSPEETSSNGDHSKPSLLSAGAELYYSPLSSVIGLSTGLRFTTLPTASSTTSTSQTSSKPLSGTSAALSGHAAVSNAVTTASSFPYTMTLTLTPLTGSLASTYSIKPTKNFSLSSRFGFNVYSWESEYVFGAEIWRRQLRAKKNEPEADTLTWAKEKASQWLDKTQKKLKLVEEDVKADRDETVFKFRVDDNWNIKTLWTGRIKELLVSAGVNVSPTTSSSHKAGSALIVSGAGPDKKWRGSIGVEVAYSSGS